MMSKDVYAAVVWALVMATITAPVMFRWAIGVFDRATPVHRSIFIGGDDKEYSRRAFVIRIAGQWSPGIQREIFNALYAQGLAVLDASIASVRADDSPDAPVSQFINSFTVLSRGKKKDFDDEKLEEMHHAFAEILNDAHAQIIFAPPQAPPDTEHAIVQVQIIGEHHSAIMHEITDALSLQANLDVIKAQFEHSLQPSHHHAKHHSHAGAPAGAPAAAEPSETYRRTSTSASPVALSRVMYKATGARKEEDLKRTAGNEEDKPNAVFTGTFFAKEIGASSDITTAKHRNQILDMVKQVQGTYDSMIMVRVLHSADVALVHSVPKLDSRQKRIVSVLKCYCQHHKELLHEICDYLDGEKTDIDILNAELDQENFKDVFTFYLQKVEGTGLSEAEKKEIVDKINTLYTSLAIEGTAVMEAYKPTGRRASKDAPPPPAAIALTSTTSADNV